MRLAKLILSVLGTLAWLALSFHLWWAFPCLHPRLILPDTEGTHHNQYYWLVKCRLSRFSPDGQYLAVYRGNERAIQLWDIHTGKQLTSFQVESYSDFCFSPDGQFLIEPGHSRFIVRRLSDGNIKYVIEDQIAPYLFSPDGTLLAGKLQPAGDLKLWDTATGREVAILRKGKRLVESQRDYQPNFHFAPDSSALAFEQDDNHIALWNVGAGRKIASISGNFWSLAFSPDGRILGIQRDKEIVLHDGRNGEELGTLAIVDGDVRAMAISPKADMLAFLLSRNKLEVQLWDIASAKTLGSVTELYHTGDLGFSADGRTLAISSNIVTHGSSLMSADHDGLEVVWSGGMGGGSSHSRSESDKNFAFFNNGKQVATKEMCKVEEMDGELNLAPTSSKWEEWRRCFTELVAGRRKTMGGDCISFFDVASQTEYASLNDVRYWLLSPDGKTLATQGYVNNDFNLGPVVLWDVPTYTPPYVKLVYSLLPPLLLIVVTFRRLCCRRRISNAPSKRY